MIRFQVCKANDGRRQEWMQENNKDVAFVFMTNNFIRKSAKKSEDG